MENHLPTSKI